MKIITRIKALILSAFSFQLLAIFLLLPVAGNAEWSATVPNPIMEYNYTYDNNGNITNIYNAVAISTSTFTYDEVNRLTSAYGLYGPNNTPTTINYSYNAVGDPTNITIPVTLTTQNGNVTDYNGKTIEYDYENRPIKITDIVHNTITEFAYDYSGQRVYKKVSSGTLTSEDYYVGNIYEESYSVDSSSPAISDSTTTVAYVYAGSMRVASLTTQATATGTESNTFYYHGDHLGSSSIITDGSGTVVRNISYQPWGNVQSNTEESGASTLDPSRKFTGQILDDSTGLYYYGARYYDPQLRRFITPDTIVQSPYDPQSLNRYAYCRNNPLIYTDPSGHVSLALFDWDFSYEDGSYSYNYPQSSGFATTLASIGAGFLPGIGEAQDFVGAVFGKDFITGDKLSGWERAISGGALFLPCISGSLFTKADDVAKLANKADGAKSLVRKELPKLTDSYKDAFKNGEYSLRTFEKGDIIYRSPQLDRMVDAPGKWFGTRRTVTKEGTESLYNLQKWGNPLESVRTYELTTDVTVYYGKVAGGNGYQILFPQDINPGSVLEFLKEAPLK